MGRLFGTDGVRGIANKDLTCELAFKLGQAGAYVLAAHNKDNPRIMLGKDTRISGDMLSYSIAAGICSVGAQAVLVDTMPTPAIAHLTKRYKLDAGVVISASHNPCEYNGIKFFNGDGYKLSDDLENEIEEYILDGKPIKALPLGGNIGRAVSAPSCINDYVNFAVSTISTDLSGLKIALDCANGAAYKVAPMAFERLGAEISVISAQPNGVNINLDCGSTHMENLKKHVVEKGFDVGIAFDGDADRMLAVDAKGNLVDGDQIMAICALDLRDKKLLSKDTIVATVMSNLGLTLMGNINQLEIIKAPVGDRYVLEHMLANDYNLGGEQSGHIIFLDHNTTGDGLVSALQLVSIMKTQNKSLEDLAKVMDIFPQVLVNARVDNPKGYQDDPEIKEAIENLTNLFADQGRVLIRPSGTEPLVRVMIEGKDITFIDKKARELAALIEKKCASQH